MDARENESWDSIENRISRLESQQAMTENLAKTLVPLVMNARTVVVNPTAQEPEYGKAPCSLGMFLRISGTFKALGDEKARTALYYLLERRHWRTSAANGGKPITMDNLEYVLAGFNGISDKPWVKRKKSKRKKGKKA